MISILDKNYFRFSGRILEINGAPCLGYTNSSLEFYVKASNSGTRITAQIGTKFLSLFIFCSLFKGSGKSCLALLS